VQRCWAPPENHQRRPLACQTPAGPDRWLRTHLCAWAGVPRNARKGYRRAWADLRAEGHVVNRKKVQRLWREEGLRVARKPRRKRGGASTCPITDADAPNVVWAIDFQFDALRCGTPVKLASMVDEHTRESLLDITDRSITSEKVIDYMKTIIAKRASPKSYAAITDPNSFPMLSVNSRKKNSVSITFHQVNLGVTGTLNPLTVACAMNA